MNGKFSTDWVMNACGVTAPLHARVEGLGEGAAFTKALPLPFVLIGRGEHNDLVLRSSAVGLRHAYVQVIGGRLFCVDLESRTGTDWGDGPRTADWLDAGQAVRIGPYRVRISGGGLDPSAGDGRNLNPLTSRGHAEGDMPELVLSFFKGATHLATGRISRPLTLLGNSRKCRVVLGDTKAAPYQASLIRTPAGTWAVDLLGGNGGLLLNGRTVRWGRLEDGDELQLAGVRIQVRLSAPAAGTPSFPYEAGTNFPLMPAGPAGALTATRHRGGPGMVEPGFPAPALPEGSDPVLVNLAYQFGSMQQQMFDQFQQTMLMMAQTFTSLHREQKDLLRHELDRARELNDEIQALQAELARRPDQAAEAGATPAISPSRPEPGETPERPRSEREPEPAPDAAKRHAAPANGTTDPNIHVLIYQRIQAMQKERDSYWQRIVQLLSGK